MSVKMIQSGQVWRHDQTGRNFLVTKVYNEALTQFAMLRPADATAAAGETLRIRVQRSAEGATLPGYTFAQDTQDF